MSYASGIGTMQQATNVMGQPEAKEPAQVTASDSMTNSERDAERKRGAY